MTYQVYYLSDYLHISESGLPGLTFVLTLVINGTSALTALVSGWLADRFQRRKFYMVVAGILAVAGFLLLITTRSMTGMFTGATVLGLGNGFFCSGHYTLPSSVLPSEQDAAKDMGVVNIAGHPAQLPGPGLRTHPARHRRRQQLPGALRLRDRARAARYPGGQANPRSELTERRG
ncbi:MFS transporter [Streptomyces sp. NPDC088348]|uniref:MFS transporter n=1 Tax=Streptomyces sp. NPDC088348 TaxID=3365853 RepID=UPI00380208C4